LIKAAPTVGVVGDFAEVPGVGVDAASVVGVAFELAVGELFGICVGMAVAFAVGTTAVAAPAFLAGAAAFGAQAASITVMTNTALIRNLDFISILSFSGMILAFSIVKYAAATGFGFSIFAIGNQKTRFVPGLLSSNDQ
jgi:hypothetical protein